MVPTVGFGTGVDEGRRMTRHSKGNNAGAVFTYDERRKMGHGTARARVGADSMRSFDCCCMTLQPCDNPVVTRDGYLYERQAILSNLLAQKEHITRDKERHLFQKRQRERQNQDLDEEKDAKRLKAFELKEHTPLASDDQEARPVEIAPTTTRVFVAGEEVTSGLKGNFWLPTNTPEVAAEVISKSDAKALCPMSGKPLRFKDLISVNFTAAAKDYPGNITSLSGSAGRYMCPVCQKVLTNSIQCAVLRKSGAALCNGCIDRFVKKESIDPTTNKKVNIAKDLIYLKSGGTGYAASGGDSKQVSKYNPSIRV